MVLCVVDDLLFASKIRATAQSVGATVSFEKDASRVVDRVKAEHPSLVIFDLDTPRLRALETIAALHADPSTQAVPTLGYVSHVQTERIAAARAAGIGEVLARSAFATQLSEILSRGA